MIVSCPECGARYRLADDAIPADGRAMRCASCKHRWFELGPEEPVVVPGAPREPAAAALLVPRDTQSIDAPGPSVDDGGRAGSASASVGNASDSDDDEGDTPPSRTVLKTLVALLLSLALWAGAAAMWIPDLPPLDLSRVPWLDGLVNPPAPARSPLTLSVTAQRQPLGDGRIVFALSGSIANPTTQAQPVRGIEGRLVAGGRVAYRWPIHAPVASLPAGHRVTFEASAIGTGDETVTVALR